MKVSIRRAVHSDASIACALVRRSIEELCVEDHAGDAGTLAAWLADKTSFNFQTLIASDQHIAVVAESTEIVGFALLNLNGTLARLYVSPGARFSGVSKAMLFDVEQKAAEAGIERITLKSTATARRFYSACGYEPDGGSSDGFGLSKGYPMSKRLASAGLDMSEQAVLHPATAQNLDALIQCDAYAQSHASRRQKLQDAITKGDCIAAFVRDEPVGYVILGGDFFDHAWVPVLVVDAAYRRRGIGAQLLAAAELAVRGEKLFISANASNHAAQRLFVRAGFERSGVIENMDEGEPELIFFKRIERDVCCS